MAPIAAIPLRTNLKLNLGLRVMLGSLVFALIAEAAMLWAAFEYQRTEATSLQQRSAAIVQLSATVAAYIQNEETARDVVTGSLSNPMVAVAGWAQLCSLTLNYIVTSIANRNFDGAAAGRINAVG